MTSSRRTWLRRAGSAGAAALGINASRLARAVPPACDAAIQRRMRISELCGDRLDLFTRVYQAWREFDGANPAHPWSREGHRRIHAGMCGDHPGMDIHKSWDFLAWHRCFVHFHERVLISLAQAKPVPGAASFRLPYWDWDRKPDIPGIYTDADSPVFMDREPNPSIGLCTSKAHLGALLTPTSFEGSDGLGGTATGEGIASSCLPHSGIHRVVSEVMKDPATAATDPLFYIHHTNMDRFWEIWARMHHQQPSQYPHDFLKTVYTFPGRSTDETFQYRVSDIIRTQSLGYDYDSYDCGVYLEDGQLPLRYTRLNETFVALDPEGLRRLRQFRPQRGREAFVYLTISGARQPYSKEGYLLFLESRTRGIPMLPLGRLSPFQSPSSGMITLSGTLAVNPQDVLNFGSGFRVVYQPAAQDGGEIRPVTFRDLKIHARILATR